MDINKSKFNDLKTLKTQNHSWAQSKEKTQPRKKKPNSYRLNFLKQSNAMTLA